MRATSARIMTKTSTAPLAPAFSVMVFCFSLDFFCKARLWDMRRNLNFYCSQNQAMHTWKDYTAQ